METLLPSVAVTTVSSAEGPLQVYIPNRAVACVPIKENPQEVKIKKGFANASGRGAILAAEVVYPNLWNADGKDPYLKPGDTVYVRGASHIQGWYQDKLTIEGKEVIIVPLAEVVAVKIKSLPAFVPSIWPAPAAQAAPASWPLVPVTIPSAPAQPCNPYDPFAPGKVIYGPMPSGT